MKRSLLPFCLAAGLIGGGAGAEDGMTVPPVQDPATLKECGACHLAFPPQMLPARSWKALMTGLADHFGENAGLSEAARTEIAGYLAANAGDAALSKHGRRFLRDIDPAATPLRITETPFWQEAHEEIPPARFTRAPVKTAANCAACHGRAAQGVFGEAEEEE